VVLKFLAFCFKKKNKFVCVKRAGKVKSVFGGGIGLKTHLGLDVWVMDLGYLIGLDWGSSGPLAQRKGVYLCL
jgi:hypothetical protein